MKVTDGIPWGGTASTISHWLNSDSSRLRSLLKQTRLRATSTGADVGAFISVINDVPADLTIGDRPYSRQSPLAGIPIAVKDVIATAGTPTTAQSLAPKPSFCDGTVDAWCVERLRQAGAIIIGKTTTLEFAKGLPERNGPFPLPRNPWNLDHWPGGSSAGSAAAVAAGIVPIALGTDTAGSVRLPAAYCGVTGFKPTRGLIPLDGCLRLAPSLDHLGLIGRSSEDCRSALLAMLPASKTESQESLERWQDVEDREIRLGLDISVIDKASVAEDVRAAFFEATIQLEEIGFKIQEVFLPDDARLSEAIRDVNGFENFAVFEGLLSRYGDLLGESARQRLNAGRSVTRDDYYRAIATIQRSKKDYLEVFQNVDFLITPTAASVAETIDSVYTHSRDRLALTRLWNGLGFPAVSFPVGFGEACLPVGFQMVGKPFTDLPLLETVGKYQTCTTWHLAIASCA